MQSSEEGLGFREFHGLGLMRWKGPESFLQYPGSQKRLFLFVKVELSHGNMYCGYRARSRDPGTELFAVQGRIHAEKTEESKRQAMWQLCFGTGDSNPSSRKILTIL